MKQLKTRLAVYFDKDDEQHENKDRLELIRVLKKNMRCVEDADWVVFNVDVNIADGETIFIDFNKYMSLAIDVEEILPYLLKEESFRKLMIEKMFLQLLLV